MCLPNSDEQLSILEHITAQCRAQDNAIERTRRQIDLMNEYRTRLIADVVTGQLDVREAAAQLPAAPPANKLRDNIVTPQEVS